MTHKITMPIGKHKGLPMEVLANDPGYLEWLMAQAWFRDRFPKHYTFIINNLCEPTETPEHNRLQTLFLRDSLLIRAAALIGLRPHSVAKTMFEVCGFDVICFISAYHIEPSWEYQGPQKRLYDVPVGLELKPQISDDYPAVLRQVLAADIRGLIPTCRVVICKNFDAAGATLSEVTEIFKRSRVHLLMLGDLLNDEEG